jgi:ferredoxin
MPPSDASARSADSAADATDSDDDVYVEDDAPGETHTLTVLDDDEEHTLEVRHGTTLRAAMRTYGVSPHGPVTEVVNCGGQGHCTLCRVEIVDGAPEPTQWLDEALAEHDWGRLACAVSVRHDMTVRLVQPL